MPDLKQEDTVGIARITQPYTPARTAKLKLVDPGFANRPSQSSAQNIADSNFSSGPRRRASEDLIAKFMAQPLAKEQDISKADLPIASACAAKAAAIALKQDITISYKGKPYIMSGKGESLVLSKEEEKCFLTLNTEKNFIPKDLEQILNNVKGNITNSGNKIPPWMDQGPLASFVALYAYIESEAIKHQEVIRIKIAPQVPEAPAVTSVATPVAVAPSPVAPEPVPAEPSVKPLSLIIEVEEPKKTGPGKSGH